MKKLILALLAVASISAANAQKNSILVYGDVGVNFDNTDNGSKATTMSVKNTNWNIAPGVGYQISNHITLGLQGGYWFGKTETQSQNVWTPAPPSSITTTDSWREWQIGAFGRYTMPLGGIFSMWTQLNASYVSGKVSMDTLDFTTGRPLPLTAEDTYNGFQATLTPALAINVHNGLALNFGIGGIGFRTVSYDKAPTTQSNFMFTFGQQINVGISKNFGCRSHHGGHHEPGMDTRKMKKHSSDDDDE